MDRDLDALEEKRRILQVGLDSKKTQTARNKLGQFSTPVALADDILRYALHRLPETEPIRFLDPAVGTGVFYSALARLASDRPIAEAMGFEIDRHYGCPAADLWEPTALQFALSDFTAADPSPRFNLLVCNPPYVRHHHLANDEKLRLQYRTEASSGTRLSGLAGLYCHFMGLSHPWMSEGALAGWLIPSEFMDVNYGVALKQYLLNKVTLLHIHRFDPNDTQFQDALVSSAVVWFKKCVPPPEHEIEFSFGGTLLEPSVVRRVSSLDLRLEPKWTRFPLGEVRTESTEPTLGDLFKIKRGIATGNNKFFILSEDEILRRDLPKEAFRPILPSPRHIAENEIKADAEGNPCLEHRLFLLDTRISEDEIGKRYPALLNYLEYGRAQGFSDTYLCRHRPVWYAQEERPAAPIVCNYLARGDTNKGHPFRFFLNHSLATMGNVYLAMYPRPTLSHAMQNDPLLLRRIWMALNEMPADQLLGEGRVYGGGLHKLEPKELANVPAGALTALARISPARQTSLFQQ